MKIAWFSPLPPLKSGISEYSELILEYLKNFATVDLWVDGFIPRREICNRFNVINYKDTEEVLPLLKTYDAIIYNMGNNAEIHSGMYEVLQEYPGIVILHDYVLHHFFAGYWLNKKNNQERYLAEVRKQYGLPVEESIRKSLRMHAKPIWETEAVFHYPLNKSVLQKVTGVVVHSEFVQKLVKDHVQGRILKVNSPVYPVPAASLNRTRYELGLPEDKIILASFGFVTPPKRIDIVLDVIANNEYLRENMYYIIIGELSPGFPISDYVRNRGLADKVMLPGYLQIEESYEYIDNADICINLRYPTMGETSGSLIRIMSLGKPTLVSNVGWYAELPDDSVVKIYPEKEKEELKLWLLRLAKNANLRQRIGNSAKSYVQKYCTPEQFVKELIFSIETNWVKHNKYSYIHLLDKVTDILLNMGQGANIFIPKISKQIEWLYPNDNF